MEPEEIAMAFNNVTCANSQHSALTEAYRDYAGLGRLPFSDDEMKKAESIFDVTSEPAAGGWRLPDGKLLDFKASGYVDHSEISKSFSKGRTDAANASFAGSPCSTEWKEEALAAGLIRLQLAPTGVYVTVWRKPTAEQLDRLYDFCEWCEDCEYADFFRTVAISVGDEYVEYADAAEFAKRAVNDIKRLSDAL